MKKKFTSIVCGFSAVSLLAFALVACDSDSPNAAPCNCNVPSSSSCDGVLESSSDEMRPISSSSLEEQPESSSDAIESSSSEMLASSSSVVASSSSVVASSSSRKMECITMSRLCPPCDSDDCPIPFMPCNQCYWEYGAETNDCETNERYVCSRFNTWSYTCHNLIDSTGNIAEDSCEYNFSAWVDCKTNKPFVCKEGRWERLPEEYSWINQKCDSTESARFVYIEYETEKGSIAKISLGYYCNAVLWQQSSTNLPERTRCEIEGDKVTISEKTYQCIGGEWEIYQKCDELKVECGYTAEELCNDYGIERYCSKS